MHQPCMHACYYILYHIFDSTVIYTGVYETNLEFATSCQPMAQHYSCQYRVDWSVISWPYIHHQGQCMKTNKLIQ